MISLISYKFADIKEEERTKFRASQIASAITIAVMALIGALI